MAIERGTARLLLAEHARRPFGGAVLELGRQTVVFSECDLRRWAQRAGFLLGAAPASATRPAGTRLDDRELFRLLGFGEVASCDASVYEDADLVMDLNRPVSPELHGRFDVVFNGGTLEHIFDVRAALANVHALLKVGGRAIHVAPSSNMVDHGFYSFSPILFGDYYSANRYDLRTLYLFECVSWTGERTLYDCLGRDLNNRLGRTANARMAGVFCVAEKTAESTWDARPMQRHFSRTWQSRPQPTLQPRAAALWHTFRERCPHAAELLFRSRALVWRTGACRRPAMPPLVGKI